MDRREELKRLIAEAREAYYNLESKYSDQQYDAWVDELSRLEPGAPEVVAVGATPPRVSVWEKVTHTVAMGSLRKANSEEELRAWAAKCREAGATTFFITHKIDGSSMELVYEAGRLSRCVTRGDGVVGEDVTENISKVPNIPADVKVDASFTVRGEIVMEKAVFQEHFADEYANPRNTAAALVRKKKGGGVECKHLKFLAYWAQFDEADQPETLLFSMKRLVSMGFECPVGGASTELEAVIARYDEEKAGRDAVPYEIDGMVVTVNNLSVLEAMGSVAMRPLGQIAWKFSAMMAETRVKNVQWGVGLTGRVTPVAIVEPVNVGGVTITNVSLHNLTMFRQLKLFEGCRVLIARRGDVIPYVEVNLDAETI